MECIPLKEIAYIESDNTYSLIYRIREISFDKKMICKSLKALEQILKKYDFIRCHKYYLVNSEKVECFSSSSKKLTVIGHQLEVSRRKEDKVFPVLLEKGIKDTGSYTANKIFRPQTK
jgi:DNA-binding LytR/AlgR family response regulator